MKASKLIEILAHHMNDSDGGDFEVYTQPVKSEVGDDTAVVRCWLYPGLKKIIIGSE